MATAQSQNILSLIETDHKKVEQLFQQLENARGAKAINYFNQIYKELSLHTRAEELVFYPAMQVDQEASSYVAEAETEHNTAKTLLEQMKEFNPDNPEFRTKLRYLKETILHHVKEEESEIFDAVRKAIDDKELERLGQEFQAVKAREEADVELALTL